MAEEKSAMMKRDAEMPAESSGRWGMNVALEWPNHDRHVLEYTHVTHCRPIAVPAEADRYHVLAVIVFHGIQPSVS